MPNSHIIRSLLMFSLLAINACGSSSPSSFSSAAGAMNSLSSSSPAALQGIIPLGEKFFGYQVHETESSTMSNFQICSAPDSCLQTFFDAEGQPFVLPADWSALLQGKQTELWDYIDLQTRTFQGSASLIKRDHTHHSNRARYGLITTIFAGIASLLALFRVMSVHGQHFTPTDLNNITKTVKQSGMPLKQVLQRHYAEKIPSMIYRVAPWFATFIMLTLSTTVAFTYFLWHNHKKNQTEKILLQNQESIQEYLAYEEILKSWEQSPGIEAMIASRSATMEGNRSLLASEQDRKLLQAIEEAQFHAYASHAAAAGTLTLATYPFARTFQLISQALRQQGLKPGQISKLSTRAIIELALQKLSAQQLQALSNQIKKGGVSLLLFFVAAGFYLHGSLHQGGRIHELNQLRQAHNTYETTFSEDFKMLEHLRQHMVSELAHQRDAATHFLTSLALLMESSQVIQTQRIAYVCPQGLAVTSASPALLASSCHKL